MHHGKHGAGHLRADSIFLFDHVANGEVATASSCFHFISTDNKYILERREREGGRVKSNCACLGSVISRPTLAKPWF